MKRFKEIGGVLHVVRYNDAEAQEYLPVRCADCDRMITEYGWQMSTSAKDGTAWLYRCRRCVHIACGISTRMVEESMAGQLRASLFYTVPIGGMADAVEALRPKIPDDEMLAILAASDGPDGGYDVMGMTRTEVVYHADDALDQVLSGDDGIELASKLHQMARGNPEGTASRVVQAIREHEHRAATEPDQEA